MLDTATAVRELTFGDAIKEAIAEEMRRDPTVVLMGEDVAEAGTTFKVLAAKERGTPVPARRYNPEVPEELEFVIDKMMAPDPRRRFQNPAEVIAALEQVSAGDAVGILPEPMHGQAIGKNLAAELRQVENVDRPGLKIGVLHRRIGKVTNFNGNLRVSSVFIGCGGNLHNFPFCFQVFQNGFQSLYFPVETYAL